VCHYLNFMQLLKFNYYNHFINATTNYCYKYYQFQLDISYSDIGNAHRKTVIF